MDIRCLKGLEYLIVLLGYFHLAESRLRDQDHLYNHFVTTVAYDSTETVPQSTVLAITLNYSDDG